LGTLLSTFVRSSFFLFSGVWWSFCKFFSSTLVQRFRNRMRMQARDVMGILLLLLVATEVSRKYMFIQGMSAVQVTSEDIHAHQFVQHMLIPPTDRRIQNPILCESPGEKCLPGEEVRCLTGLHVGCHCDHIRLCFPHASHCTVYNSTHSLSCGF